MVSLKPKKERMDQSTVNPPTLLVITVNLIFLFVLAMIAHSNYSASISPSVSSSVYKENYTNEGYEGSEGCSTCASYSSRSVPLEPSVPTASCHSRVEKDSYELGQTPSVSFMDSQPYCESSATYPSPGCSKENPDGDAMLFTGHYAAVQGNPNTVGLRGEYRQGSICYAANGGSTIYEKPFGHFESNSALSPGVTDTFPAVV